MAEGIRNGTVILRVVDKLKLREDPDFLPPRPEGYTDAEIVELMSRQVDAELRRGMRIIDIRVRDRSPERAQMLAATFLEEFKNLIREQNAASSSKSRSALEEQAEAQRLRVLAAEEKLQEFRLRHATIALDEDKDYVGTKLADLDRMLSDAANETLIRKAQYDQYKQIKDDAIKSGSLMEIASICEKEMVEFKLVPTCFQVLLSGLHLESVGGIPILGISRLPLHNTLNQFLKRAVDLLGGLVGCLLSAPVIALFGFLIYRENPGPIFYKQRRLGANGKTFDMVKLRSMKLDAEKTGVGWTVKDDPRCLRVGAFMRKWNIDEIPQFWNVLKGDMSLVGPRPERPELIENFKEEIPHYNARHNIKPGITGWAQVNGLRGDTDLSERVGFDLHYIENWNVMFDFQIMFLTFIKREGAC